MAVRLYLAVTCLDTAGLKQFIQLSDSYDQDEYLLAARTVHSAFNETEGAADFVFLRLSLGRNDIFIPSLFFDSGEEEKTSQ